MKPHIHAEVIKAWADGAKIEFLELMSGHWFYTSNPDWHIEQQYRVKPVTKPDVVRYVNYYGGSFGILFSSSEEINSFKVKRQDAQTLELICDGETRALKSIKMI